MVFTQSAISAWRGRRGFAHRDLAAQLGAIVLDRGEEVLDAKDFGFKLLRDWHLAPA